MTENELTAEKGLFDDINCRNTVGKYRFFYDGFETDGGRSGHGCFFENRRGGSDSHPSDGGDAGKKIVFH